MPRKPVHIVLGTSGLKKSGGMIYEEFLTELKGQKGIKVFKEMANNDPIIGAILYTIKSTAKQLAWFAEPSDDSAKAKEAAEFVSDCMHNMRNDWIEFMDEALSMLEYGWSFHEIIYKRRKDGKIGWYCFAPRSQTTLDSWVFNDRGDVIGMQQVDPYSEGLPVFIPLDKALLFRTTSILNSPEGKSILRNSYTSWYNKKYIQQIEAIGIERDLTGYPVAWVPPEMMDANADAATRAAYDEIKNLVTNVRRDEQEGIVFPLDYDENGNKRFDFTLMTSGGSRSFDTNAIIKRYNADIAITVLHDFILLGTSGEGSFALISEKIKLANVALNAILDSFSNIINKHAVPKLMRLNGYAEDVAPSITHSDVTAPDLNSLSRYIERLSRAGISFTEDSEELKGMAGIGSDKVASNSPSSASGGNYADKPWATAGGSKDRLA